MLKMLLVVEEKGSGEERTTDRQQRHQLDQLLMVQRQLEQPSTLLSPNLTTASTATTSFNLLQPPSTNHRQGFPTSSHSQINPGCDSLLLRKQAVCRCGTIPVRAPYATFHFELHKFVQGSIPTVQGTAIPHTQKLFAIDSLFMMGEKLV
jgi:hypothetical protein